LPAWDLVAERRPVFGLVSSSVAAPWPPFAVSAPRASEIMVVVFLS
jgi:hypothetical protein